MIRVAGLDVCKSSVVCCLLEAETRPIEVRDCYYDLDFLRFNADAKGLKALLAIKPDVAVLEPSGTNYTKIWAIRLAEAGIKIILVGHTQLRRYRQNLDLPDKDDQADALALACYYLEHQHSPRRFVRQRDPVVAQIRDCVLRLHHLNRLQNPTVNRIRQDLAWQFPEAAGIGINAALFWGWLAQKRKSSRYDGLYKNTIGLGLKTETVNAAKALYEIHQRERALELEMRSLIKDSRFSVYRKVFALFGFGERTEALLLSQIYPLDNYLNGNRKEEIKVTKGKISGKLTRRYLSRRRFKKTLGIAPTREESGDSKSTKKAGSSLCRMALWQWIFTRIEPARSRPKNEIGRLLGQWLDKEKQSRPVKLARSRAAAKAVELLFCLLVKEITHELD